jgi:hypothetical protein
MRSKRQSQKTLHGKSHGTLFSGRLSPTKAKWFHRNIDGSVHDPEHSSRKPQNRELGIINNAAEAKIAPAKSKVFFVPFCPSPV